MLPYLAELLVFAFRRAETLDALDAGAPHVIVGDTNHEELLL